MSVKTKWNISAAGLHIIAMVFMLCDHLWGTLFMSQEWLTCIGRLAFPIFAFMIVEGYRHTSNIKRYMLRLLICALLAEVPFDMMISGDVFYPFHQNVIWTFLISLIFIMCIEKLKKCRKWIFIPLTIIILLSGYILGYLFMVDYYGVGVLTVLMFYFLHERNWITRLCQVFCMCVLNIGMLGGYFYGTQLLGFEINIVQQGFAVFALIPIWLYQGRQGMHSKPFQYFCYAFYPVHMLILALISDWIG